MARRGAIVRRRLLLAGLGDNWVTDAWNDLFHAQPIQAETLPQAIGTSTTPYVPAPGQATPAATQLWDSIAATPGTTIADLMKNAAVGNLTQDQVNQLAAAAAASNIAAGADPDTAAAQAQADIDAALANATLPGALGIKWTGALPASTNWVDQAASNVANPFGAGSSSWIWWLVGGLAVIVAAKEL